MEVCHHRCFDSSMPSDNIKVSKTRIQLVLPPRCDQFNDARTASRLHHHEEPCARLPRTASDRYSSTCPSSSSDSLLHRHSCSSTSASTHLHRRRGATKRPNIQLEFAGSGRYSKPKWRGLPISARYTVRPTVTYVSMLCAANARNNR